MHLGTQHGEVGDLQQDHPLNCNAFSLEPIEMQQPVDSDLEIETFLGNVNVAITRRCGLCEVFRLSLRVAAEAAKGETLIPKNIESFRRGNGLTPKVIKQFLGTTATKDISRGTPLAWDHVSVRLK